MLIRRIEVFVYYSE